MKYIFSILTVCVLTQVSLAEVDDNRSNLYLGAGGSFSSLSSVELSETGVIGSSLIIGYDFNEYLAVEFRKGSSLSSGSSLHLDDSMVLYTKGRYPVSDNAGMYVLAGFGSTDISSGIGEVTSNKSFSYALGLDYKISTPLSLYIDYTVVSSTLSQVNFGITYYYDNKGMANLPSDAPEVQSYKEKKADEKLMEELRIKEKLEEKKKKEAEEKKKEEAEEKLKLPTIVKVDLLHKEDTKKPILVYFFELKSNEQFKRMDYEELINDEKEMLNGEIISRSKEILKPGKMMSLSFNVKFDSTYYAVVAALNEVKNDDSWRHIVKVNAHEVNKINLMLDHKKIMEFSK